MHKEEDGMTKKLQRVDLIIIVQIGLKLLLFASRIGDFKTFRPDTINHTTQVEKQLNVYIGKQRIK